MPARIFGKDIHSDQVTQRHLKRAGGVIDVDSTTKTGETTLDTDDVYIQVSGTVTINLPAVEGNKGINYYIKNIGTGTVTVDASGSEEIEGETTQDLYQDECMQVLCTGTDWRVI